LPPCASQPFAAGSQGEWPIGEIAPVTTVVPALGTMSALSGNATDAPTIAPITPTNQSLFSSALRQGLRRYGCRQAGPTATRIRTLTEIS
jgi:hypothetical protein